MNRRKAITAAAAMLGMTGLRDALGTVGSMAELGFAEIPDGALAEQILHALPGKVPLIKKSFRPPNYETPIEYFRTPMTPNRAFFVRWHLAAIPQIALKDWKLTVGGESAERELTLTMDSLRKDFKPAQVAAVCQCSGNRRGLFEPHVAGVEWGIGAMGNAVWKGVRLKDVLAKAGVKGDALEVVFDGADHGAIEKTPDFVKSIPIDMALSEDTLIAFEMNGLPLPHWNGFPARIVVPGWTGTYWVKGVTSIKVMAKPEKNFWMSAAYRLPKGRFKTPSFKSQVGETNEPITAMVVNSLITSVKSGQQVARGKPLEVRGIAWDGGTGIAKVEVSSDGMNWAAAKLGKDLGKFSFREFALTVPTKDAGAALAVMARATSNSGETQVNELIHNPPGYHHNVIQRLYVEVV